MPRILDAGCGHGRDAHLMQGLGAKVTAIDVSTEMIRIAQEHYGVRARAMDIRDIDYIDSRGMGQCFPPPSGCNRPAHCH